MTKLIIIFLVAAGGLALWFFPLRKVEETEYLPYVTAVGGKKITLSLAGSYTQAHPKIIKGAPYRFSIYFSSPQRDEIQSISVSNLVIVSANDATGKITLPDKGEKISQLNSDKAYYWLIAYDGLSFPEEKSNLRCEIRLESKGGKIEHDNVEWVLVPVRKDYHVNTILEALKGI